MKTTHCYMLYAICYIVYTPSCMEQLDNAPKLHGTSHQKSY